MVAADTNDQVVTIRPICRQCGCTDDDCRECFIRTGGPCFWVEPDLCSACRDLNEGYPRGRRRRRHSWISGAGAMLVLRFADLLADPAQTEGYYFSRDYDAERLFHKTLPGYVTDECNAEDPPPQLVVFGLRRATMKPEWLKLCATQLVEQWGEWWGEEFGPWDDAPDDGGDEKEALELLTKWAARAHIYRHDPVVAIVLTADDIRSIFENRARRTQAGS